MDGAVVFPSFLSGWGGETRRTSRPSALVPVPWASPALHSRASSRLYFFLNKAANDCTEAKLPRSKGRQTNEPLLAKGKSYRCPSSTALSSSVMAWRAASARSGERQARIMVAPILPMFIAVARPMPVLAPVTITTLSRMSVPVKDSV